MPDRIIAEEGDIAALQGWSGFGAQMFKSSSLVELWRSTQMRDPLSHRSLLLAGLVLMGIPLAACNTVEGAGEDVESFGEAVDEGADEAGDDWDEDGDWD